MLVVTSSLWLFSPPYLELGFVESSSTLIPGTRLSFLLAVFFFLPLRDARGGSPPGAVFIGKLPPFDFCGSWIVRGPYRGPFALPGLAYLLWALAPYTPRGGDVPFYRFQQVLSGSLAPQGHGVGRRGHPETTTGLRAISGPRAFQVSPLRCPGAPGCCGLGVSCLDRRVDFLVVLGGPRETRGPVIKVFPVRRAASQRVE